MAAYAFAIPILPGKTDEWKAAIKEIAESRRAEWAEREKRLGINTEKIWLQRTPMGDMVVLSWDVDDFETAFRMLMTSDHPFDKEFRQRVVQDLHGMNPADPPPPANELVFSHPG